MPDVSIDRLKLHLTGFEEEDARQLVRLIAEGLGGAQLPGAGKDVSTMNVKVAAPAGASMKSVSEQVLADMVRQLKRSI